MSTATQQRAAATIRVQDVWFSPLAGIGQTTMKYEGHRARGTLKQVAIAAARTQSTPPLPNEVHEHIVAGRLRRGALLPDGMRYAFVDWTVRSPTSRISRFVTHALLHLREQRTENNPQKETLVMANTPAETAAPTSTVASEVEREFAPSGDDAELFAPLVSDEFKRGVREAAEAMKHYFLDENEGAMYDVSITELESFEQGTIQSTLYDEQQRLERAAGRL